MQLPLKWANPQKGWGKDPILAAPPGLYDVRVSRVAWLSCECPKTKSE